MDLQSLRVHQALVAKGVENIHHANTVLTACQFLRVKALLSRGTVESRGLKQTSQYSDKLDKRYSMWFDVFTDSVDIHARAGTENRYGPVLFVFDVSMIERAYTGRIWVTKLNPTKWRGRSKKERWFQSSDDLNDNFSYGTFDHMIVFRHCGGELPFRGFLREIILDNPEMETKEDVDLFSAAYGALRLAMTDSGLDVPIRKRECATGCQCKRNYRRARKNIYERFIPGI